jgi:hypothetical protein
MIRGGVPGKDNRGELKRPRNFMAEDEAPPFGSAIAAVGL